jgi:ribosomal protein S18 acetylase RimI-like enzyme
LQAEITLQGIRFIRLLVSGTLSGFAAYGPAAEPGVMKLHKLYLHPDLQGRGLGSRLLQHCEREASGQGARKLILAVNKHNTKAIAAYERNGFVVVKSVVKDIGGGFVMDDFIMAKVLSS